MKTINLSNPSDVNESITINLYNFNELNPTAQITAINEYRSIRSIYNDISGEMKDKLEELLKENNIESLNDFQIYYSLSYSQGDGAMFEGLFSYKGYTANIEHRGRYYHYNSKDIGITDKDDNNVYEGDKFYDEFNELYISICKELESFGYTYIDFLESDENIIDKLENNDFLLFTEEGKLA